MSVDDIRHEVGRYFLIDIRKFLLEIYDENFKDYIILNDIYLRRIHNNVNKHTNDSYSSRIRSINEPIFNMSFDTIETTKYSPTRTTSPQTDHIIVWLDKYIGNLGRYQQLKNYFKSIVAVEWPNFFFKKVNYDIDNLIRINDIENVNRFDINYIRDEIYVFSTTEDCLIFIEKVFKSKKTIFFICSDSLAKDISVKIYENKFIYSIYILTINMLDDYEWACDYIEKVHLFTHELDLLAKLTRDIADYYMEKSVQQTTKNLQHRLTYLHWTRMLWNNATHIDDSVTSRYKLRCIDEQVKKLQNKFEYLLKDENDKEQFGIECQEVFYDMLNHERNFPNENLIL